PIAEFVRKHGDGVKDIALLVDDAEQAYKETTKRGAISVMEPTVIKDPNGQGFVKRATIGTYGDFVHSFVERKNFTGLFLAGFAAAPFRSGPRPSHSGLYRIDHIVGNVELGQMNHWMQWYEDVMGFTMSDHFDDEHIKTEYAALMSKVMQS